MGSNDEQSENALQLCARYDFIQRLELGNEKSAQRGGFWDGHPADIRGSFARISWPKTSLSGKNPGTKNKHFGADIHDPKARTSTTLRDFHKLRSEKLWAQFSFPKNGLRNVVLWFGAFGIQLRPEAQNAGGGARFRGPEVLGPLKGLGTRPLISASRGLGNPLPGTP